MNNKDLVNVLNQIVVNLGNQETKAQKKLFKIYEKLKVYLDEYKEQLDEIRLDNASVDDKNQIIKDDKGDYKYTKDAIKNMMVQIKALDSQELKYEKLNVVNPSGLEVYVFLKEWVNGIEFTPDEDNIFS
jgi:hypothetical protein